MVGRHDYRAEAVAAARSVLIELTHLLGEYRDQIVLVGGWVPEFLLEGAKEQHVGSLDVDLAIDHRHVPQEVYETIQGILLGRGYELGREPFIFNRRVGEVLVQVDFLSGEYGGTGRGRRHQKVQEIKARKARGCDLAFELNTEVEIVAELPGGGVDRVRVKVASIVPFLVMKAAALRHRLKEKDAWDIDYCIRNFPGGLEALVAEITPHREEGLVREALETPETSSRPSIASEQSSLRISKGSTTQTTERFSSEGQANAFGF
jgi:hypothetical protein